MKPIRQDPARARQIEIALRVKRLEANHIVPDIKALELQLAPRILLLEQAIRKFDETYVWDLSYPYLKLVYMERNCFDTRCFEKWNPHGPTPEPSRDELKTHFLNQRQLYNYHQKLRKTGHEYKDALRELDYWDSKFGPLKSTPGFKL